MNDQTTDQHTCHNEKTAAGPAWKCPRCSLPPAHQTAPLADRLAHPEAVREQLLRSMDFSYAVGLGYTTPDELLATYDASRTPVAQAALRDRIAAALYEHSHPGWALRYADLDQDQRDTYLARADAVLAALPAPVDRAALVRAAASFVRDTYSGEWADDAAATLETDADKIERGEPCSLLRLAAVLPATTDPTAEGAQLATDYAEERAERKVVQGKLDRARDELKRLRVGRAAVLREEADRVDATRAGFPIAVQNGITWATAELRRHAAELRRVADETAATETQADNATLLDLVRDFLDPDPCSFDHHGYCQAHGYLGGEPMSCPHGRAKKLLAELEQPAAGARQDGEQP